MNDLEYQALLQCVAQVSQAQSSTNRLLQNLTHQLLNIGAPAEPGALTRQYAQIYSQNFEDDIIADIFGRIGETSRIFVEIGVESGVQCNTRALLERGWRGLWIEGNEAYAQIACANLQPYIAAGRLVVAAAHVTAPSVTGLIADHLGDAPIDFLSIDIDYNTSHIWRALGVNARVACIEYNANFPANVEWEVPYEPNRAWDGTNYYGASLKTLERIGVAKNQRLVGCDRHGINAFFVADDCCDQKFLRPYTAERHYQPPRYELVGHYGHPPLGKSPGLGHATWLDDGDAVRLDRVIALQGLPKFAFRTHRSLQDQYISAEIEAAGVWEPFETRLVMKLVPLFEVFIDIGANIGWYTKIASLTKPPDGRVISFEPDPENFKLLQANLNAYTGERLSLVNSAVSDADGHLDLYLAQTNQGDHRIYPSVDQRTSVRVPVITLDSYFGDGALGPFLLKSDTQGSEPKVLRGAMAALGPALATSVLILEFWPFGMSESGEDVEAFIEVLSRLPLKAFIIDGVGGVLRPFEWSELALRCVADLAPEHQRFVDLLMVAPAGAAYEAVSEFMAV